MLDLSVHEGKQEQAKAFSHEIAKMLNVEPGTLIYEYYFDAQNKAFLYEVYKSDQDALEHKRISAGANGKKGLENSSQLLIFPFWETPLRR